MPSHPINDDPMDSAARSRRSLLAQRQELAQIRDNIQAAVDVLVVNGKLLQDLRQTKAADDMFMMAELMHNSQKILSKRLKRHEDKISTIKLPQRKPMNENPLKPKEFDLVLMAETLQKSYAAKRAALRPLTDARFGHLAKAEKAGVTE